MEVSSDVLLKIPQFKQMSPQLLVADLERSIEFYTNSLDFNLEFRFEDFYAGVGKSGLSIHLKTGRPTPEERNSRQKNQDLDILFSVDGIEKLYEEFNNRSIPCIQPLRAMEYGKEFYISDPDGYILGFVETA